MSKRNIRLLSACACVALLGAGCLGGSAEPQTPEEAIATQYDAWAKDHAGGTPEEIVDAKVADLEKDWGAPDLSYYGTNGQPLWDHAAYVADALGLDYQKLAYIQSLTGTYGIESTVAAMDQNAPNVADVLSALQEYYGVTSGNEKYFQDIFTGTASDQEKAELIFQRIADAYKNFSHDEPVIYASEKGLIDDLENVTGIERKNLEIVYARFSMSAALNLLPDTLPYKKAALQLLDE